MTAGSQTSRALRRAIHSAHPVSYGWLACSTKFANPPTARRSTDLPARAIGHSSSLTNARCATPFPAARRRPSIASPSRPSSSRGRRSSCVPPAMPGSAGSPTTVARCVAASTAASTDHTANGRTRICATSASNSRSPTVPHGQPSWRAASRWRCRCATAPSRPAMRCSSWRSLPAVMLQAWCAAHA